MSLAARGEPAPVSAAWVVVSLRHNRESGVYIYGMESQGAPELYAVYCSVRPYSTLHYTTLHYTALRTLHLTTLHYTKLHCIQLHHTTLHYIEEAL